MKDDDTTPEIDELAAQNDDNRSRLVRPCGIPRSVYLADKRGER